MTLLAVPYVCLPSRVEINTRILDEVMGHPDWFALPASEEDRRVRMASILANPRNLLWEVWQDQEFVGILMLDNIAPTLEARFHFCFWDHNLVGKRRLIKNFLGTAFRDFGFRRITMDIPDHATELLKVVRRFGFRYEGEQRINAKGRGRLEGLGVSVKSGSEMHAAALGSRKEGAHWFDGKWHDVMVLRILVTEWTG